MAKKAVAEWKHKASMFYRISFPEREVSKKWKAFFFLHYFYYHCYFGNGDNRRRITITRSRHHLWRMGSTTSNSRLRQPRLRAMELKAERLISAASMEYESSDNDRHFKRKSSRLLKFVHFFHTRWCVNLVPTTLSSKSKSMLNDPTTSTSRTIALDILPPGNRACS
ncbi:hypothetical protein C1H46_033345 [Malus baccata]|uniref:Uncharacterized protein n=1 Tax=Malus baccata TaxID=106549 RepID=A0A540L3N9_MALBA|nr:hypothetical protein C1H46_033345 [Malus baccata]